MTGMRARRRIVVGVDGTAASAAVRWAVREARLRHAAVHIISACHHDGRLLAPYAPPSEAPDPAGENAAARAIVTATAEAARRRLPPGRVKAELTDEPPARALVDRTAGAEMLVLGTTRPGRQRPGQPPEAMGPVTRACLRHAHCPVVIVAAHDQLAVYSLPPEPAQARDAPPSCAAASGVTAGQSHQRRSLRGNRQGPPLRSPSRISRTDGCPGPLAGIDLRFSCRLREASVLIPGRSPAEAIEPHALLFEPATPRPSAPPVSPAFASQTRAVLAWSALAFRRVRSVNARLAWRRLSPWCHLGRVRDQFRRVL